MANIVTRPLSIFRKNDSSKPQSQLQSHSLHTRWGDAAISAPTDGSWNQYTTFTPHQSSSSTRRSKSKNKNNSKNESMGKPAYEVEYVPRTHQLIEPRPSSTSTSLSRRLSIRLTPRSKSSRTDCDTTERQPLVERRAQFAYKPIRQDYLSEVAEKTPSAPRITVNSVDKRSASPSPASSLEPTPSPSSSRFRYIPACPRYEEEFARSRLSRAYSVSSGGSLHAGDDGNWEEGFKHTCERVDSGSGSRRSSSSASAAKKRVSARRMTMTMVPDAEEIYG
ncbi:hypothetical protein IFM51744_00724 [Aspergillus udagawae]|uniref:Uncharacterized protein n=1 Tax=Aspergillus udagawae TaxID=91492 RepID=A0A8H3NBU9_9EURO|nr:hypothetical protein IFM46972_02257 [Aspergillus udagawae]GFF29031.1 hypothetical protein IFM51744_00724 [Aspergillus udagawae]GFF75966.1 hypothetical protein IFM53868_01714 [Aspergillus udagawae]GFG11252.1 hypothetical protein IFM5058_05332 [Aspergillus udagawae]